MSSLVRACPVSEVAEGTAVGLVLEGCPVAVVRSNGNLYAIRDVCSHANVALSEGEVENGAIECWLHGSMFNLTTGEAINLPATEPVAVYPVHVEGDDVLVELPSTAAPRTSNPAIGNSAFGNQES